MKFGQLLEYNMRNVFFLNLTRNAVEKLFPEPFEKPKLIVSLDQWSKVLYSLFLLYARLRTIQIIETKLQTTLF